MTYHLYVRTAYADPLERLTSFEHDGVPRLEDLPVEVDPAWLEAVLIPDEAITWVLRDGDLVTEPGPRPATEEVPA
ncbi:hypothetical protein [Egicoccus sp. AB-alg2]|uniref:hypothetical protein n=1 Tax=Egicoccus sp. AB-alg2 TaxID=3242693 RepID=UPI00359EB75B